MLSKLIFLLRFQNRSFCFFQKFGSFVIPKIDYFVMLSQPEIYLLSLVSKLNDEENLCFFSNEKNHVRFR